VVSPSADKAHLNPPQKETCLNNGMFFFHFFFIAPITVNFNNLLLSFYYFPKSLINLVIILKLNLGNTINT